MKALMIALLAVAAFSMLTLRDDHTSAAPEGLSFIVVAPATKTIPPTTTSTTTTMSPLPTTIPVPIVTPQAPAPTPFFACVRWRESRGDYTVSDPTGTFHGAYQIYQGGWDAVAASIGRDDLVGVAPNVAAPAEQDLVAQAMFDQYGSKPWGGYCE